MKDFGITPIQSRTLMVLYENRERAFSQKDLERALMLRGSTVNGILDRMEEKGFLIRRPSAADGRRKDLILTEAGLRLREAFLNSMAAAEAEIRQGFSREEAERFRSYLLRVIQNLKSEEWSDWQ